MRRVGFWCLAAAAVWLTPVRAQKMLARPAVAVFLDPQPGAPQQADAMLQQFQAEFGPQFRLILRTELHFLRAVSQPTKAQYDKIAADGDKALQETMKKCAAHWRGMRGGPAVADDTPDPRTPVSEAIAKSAQANLPAEQAARYRKELDVRAAARKRSTALGLVVCVDKVLVLTKEQRDQLLEVLENNWNKTWDNPMWLMYGGQYFPQMPDSKILPLLTESQKAVWRGVPKGNVHFGFQLNLVQGLQLPDEKWDEAAPAQETPER